MRTIHNIKNGDDLSILGFGCMRLPHKNGIADGADILLKNRDAHHRIK